MSSIVATPRYLSERAITWRPLLGGMSQTVSAVERRPQQMKVHREILDATWFKPVVNDLVRAAALPQAWDSYFGVPLRPELAAEALVFLSRFLRPENAAPQVVPLSDGGVQLEWHQSGLDLEITFPVGEEPELYLHDHQTGSEHEVLITSSQDPELTELFGVVRDRL